MTCRMKSMISVGLINTIVASDWLASSNQSTSPRQCRTWSIDRISAGERSVNSVLLVISRSS
jgi:hypothetical protein